MSVLSDKMFFSMTSEYLCKYLPNRHSGNQNTVKAYTDALTIFRRYITDVSDKQMEKFQFTDLTYDLLLDYRDYLSSKYKPRTVNHRLIAIVAYMKFVASKRVEYTQVYLNILDVPLVNIPSKIKEMIDEKETLSKLLDAPKSSKKGIRDRAILVLIYDAAIRVSELLLLNFGDVNIDADEPYIRVHGKGDKDRIVGLSSKTIPILQQYMNLYHKFRRERDFPFIYTIIKEKVGRMSARNVERIVEKYGDIVREDDSKIPDNVYPHMLRRTRATGWYRDGVPIDTIAVILGHSNTSTTRKSYASPSLKMLRENMDSGIDVIPNTPESEEPLWKNDEDLAHLCGLR